MDKFLQITWELEMENIYVGNLNLEVVRDGSITVMKTSGDTKPEFDRDYNIVGVEGLDSDDSELYISTEEQPQTDLLLNENNVIIPDSNPGWHYRFMDDLIEWLANHTEVSMKVQNLIPSPPKQILQLFDPEEFESTAVGAHDPEGLVPELGTLYQVGSSDLVLPISTITRGYSVFESIVDDDIFDEVKLPYRKVTLINPAGIDTDTVDTTPWDWILGFESSITVTNNGDLVTLRQVAEAFQWTRSHKFSNIIENITGAKYIVLNSDQTEIRVIYDVSHRPESDLLLDIDDYF